ncbi:MAG: phosphate:Na+ symporter [Candidatus Marinamargulisbacteria bacterium]|jgi:phosphate:Na+ symporter
MNNTVASNLFLLINILGGLGVFLYGLKLLSTSLQRTSSEKLKAFFDFLTRNKVLGVVFGALVTCILQSSSATTVLMVGFANAGVVKLSQCISVIFGANIGTTITAQIIAFKASEIALPLIAVGSGFYLFSKSKAKTSVGEILVGLGLLFYGLKIMGSFLKPLKEIPAFSEALVQFGQVPLYGVIAGMIITMIIQSSSATTGMIVALGSLGLIDLQSAFCLELGSNIGTTITAQLAAIGTNVTAKRAAWAHTLFNVIGSGYMLILLYVKVGGQPIFLHLINELTPGNGFAGENLPRHFANAHTIFNVTNVIIMFPFINKLARLTELIVPGKIGPAETSGLDPRMLNTPAIAFDQVVKETSSMIDLSKDMTKYMYQTVYRNKEKAIETVAEQESALNKMQNDIISFTIDINPENLTDEDVQETNAMIQIVDHAERIGDHNKAIIHHYQLLKNGTKNFSPERLSAIKELYQVIQKMYKLVPKDLKVISNQDRQSIRNFEAEIQDIEAEIRKQNISDIQKKVISPKEGNHSLKLVNNMVQIPYELAKIVNQIPSPSGIEQSASERKKSTNA